MKKILTILLLAATPVLDGCHGDLDIVQDNLISAGNMWREQSDAVTATYGAWSKLRTALKTENDIYLCWGEMRGGLWGPGTNGTLSSVSQTQVHTSSMSTTNAFADWTALYSVVNQANLVIRHTPQIEMTSSAEALCLGNAHFLRAWCYFWIGRIWGDAPLAVTGYETYSEDMYLARSPKAYVMKQVGDDITQAERYVTDPSDKYAATPAAVQMLKADYALWMYRVMNGGKTYLDMAGDAIDALELSAEKLEPNYADIFAPDNKAGREVILAVLLDKGESTGGPGYHLAWNSNYIAKQYWNNPVPITGSQQWWWYTDAYKQLLAADPNDTRHRLTLCSAEYGIPKADGSPSTVEWTAKGVGQMIDGVRVFDSDFILYRYAEAFLMDAELRYLRGDYGGALSSIGVVTGRACGNTDYYTDTTPGAVRQAIIDEYLKEMVGEGRTWWMLVRMGAAGDYNSYIAEKAASNPNILLWPITQDAMYRNSKLKQTQGWY
jgi:hypothetical protein